MTNSLGMPSLQRRVYDYIKKERKISRTVLMRRVSYLLSAKELSKVLNVLVDAGMVEEQVAEANGLGRRGTRHKTVYSARREWSIEEVDNETIGEEMRTGSPRESLHRKLETYLEEIGKILRRYPQVECHEKPYIYDVVWREFARSPRATHVFEVQDKGSLVGALAKLQHARDIWGSKLFIVITGIKDRTKLLQLVEPLFAGTFHRLSEDLTVLNQEDVEKLYESLSSNKELINRLLSK